VLWDEATMASHRHELIADWRHELTAAETVVADSPRAAWLARVRVRLYRFLLRCYGGEAWSVGETIKASQPAVDDSSEFSVFSGSELAGKPVKSEANIRAVLKAVAGAQDGVTAAGPLAAGLDGESWVIVAAASSKLKVGRCQQLLRAAGITARTAYRGDDHMVEVPAKQRHLAFDLIERNRRQIHAPPRTPRTQRIPLWARIAAVSFASVWLTGVLAAGSYWMIWALTAERADPVANFLDQHEFYALWGSVFVLVWMLVFLRMSARPRPVPEAKHRESR
jgi:hypothetical protein